MKKKIAAMVIAMTMLLGGCGETIINEYGNEVVKIGPYIEISCQEGYDPNSNHYYFRTMYHEKSKIVYYVTTSGYRFDVTEAHEYDDEGHPIMLFYKNGKIVRKDEFN